MVNVLHAEEYQGPDFNEMIKTTVRLLDKYNTRFDNSCRISVDAANPSFISTLKQAVNEDPDYTKQIQYYKYSYPSIYDLQFLQHNMFVIPVPFSKEHKAMLAHCKELMEYQNGYKSINPKVQQQQTHSIVTYCIRAYIHSGYPSLPEVHWRILLITDPTFLTLHSNVRQFFIITVNRRIL